MEPRRLNGLSLPLTLMLLWEEYCDANSDSFSYAWFCERYKEWAGRLNPTLRQVHVAGEKLFVDYSGHTMEVVDGLSSEVRPRRSSSPCSAPRTTPTPKPVSPRACRIASRVRAFAYFGGTTRQTVSDNLKAGISRGLLSLADGQPDLCRSRPPLPHRHRSGTAISPAGQSQGRSRGPNRRAMDLAHLRNRRFFSLAALNEAIYALLVELNDRPLRSWRRSRRELLRPYATVMSGGHVSVTGRKQYDIDKQTVMKAYKLVKANAGDASVDKVDFKGNLYKVWNRMSSGSYFPPAVRAVPIPKKNGGQRILGVPTVADRVAQTVVKLQD